MADNKSAAVSLYRAWLVGHYVVAHNIRTPRKVLGLLCGRVMEGPMRRTRTGAIACSLALALALAACGGDDDDDGTAGGTESPAAAEGKVGVILPDTETSVRWETADAPFLEQAFADAGIEADIQNAQGDAGRMATIADAMITEGVTVLAIVNLDSESGAAIQEKAKAAGVATIDYDRLTLNGSADYYVSFDNVKVGELQGQGLAQCLGDTAANIVYLNGAPTDNNATLFANGAHEVLDPMTNYTVVADQAVPDWDNQQAATIFEGMYTQQAGNIQGVLAANDGLGNAAISILKKNGVNGTIPVTGQDATVQGLQNVLTGDQCMTVYKAVQKEAQGLADLAIALINGEQGETNGETEDTESGRMVPSLLLDPEAIFRDNVKTVIDDGYVSAADVCTADFAAACTELGIS